jgi:hypothetical protein
VFPASDSLSIFSLLTFTSGYLPPLIHLFHFISSLYSRLFDYFLLFFLFDFSLV